MSKIATIYDNIKYDCQFNADIAPISDPGAQTLFRNAQYLAHIVVAQEYGMESEEKTQIASEISVNLIRKILLDMVIASGVPTDSEFFPEAMKKHSELYRLNHDHADNSAINSANRMVRTRLYFTSESHITSMFNLLRSRTGMCPPLLSDEVEASISKEPELNYMSRIVIRVYEDKGFPPTDPRRFLAQMYYSTGASFDSLNPEAYSVLPGGTTSIFGERDIRFPSLSENRVLHEGLTLETLLTFLQQFIPAQVKTRGSSTSLSSGGGSGDSIPRPDESPFPKASAGRAKSITSSLPEETEDAKRDAL